MRLYDEYFLNRKDKEMVNKARAKLKKRKLTLKKVVEEGGLRWVTEYPSHNEVYAQGYISEKFRYKIGEMDLVLLILGAYPDLGGYVQIYPDNFFVVKIDYIPRTLELKKQKAQEKELQRAQKALERKQSQANVENRDMA